MKVGLAVAIGILVGVGRINEIYAVVPIVDIDGKNILQVAKGGVFSFYEFHWPADDRLTDEKWRQILDEGNAPSLPEWTGNFMVSEGAYSDLANGVSTFQKDMTNIYWDPGNSIENMNPAQEPFREEITVMAQSKRYMGHQLVNMGFRSFDLQSETRAVVTTRETWKDQLFEYSGDYVYDGQVIKERGPYVLDVTYVLEKVQEPWGVVWKVVQAQFSNQPPGW